MATDYSAPESYASRFEQGDKYEKLCIKLLLVRAKLQYVKNPKPRKTDLMDKHEMYPMIEVKSCTSNRIAIDEETGLPKFMIVQRYKDSKLDKTDSGPWDTIKTDKEAFYIKFFETSNYTGVIGFRAADLAAYCEAAILNEDFDDYYDKDHNIGNVEPDSHKLAHRYYLTQITKHIDHWVGFNNICEAIRSTRPAAWRDLYEAYVDTEFRSAGSRRPPRPRNP